MRNATAVFGLLALATLFLPACGAREEPSSPASPAASAPPPAAGPAAEARYGPYPASRFCMERDLFLPAVDPETVPAEEADFLGPQDEVFGIVVGDEARAYPVTMLCYHHAVNDVVAGRPVAVTY